VPLPDQPEVVVYDVNETLSDMSAMPGRFADVGAPTHMAGLWFATLLRDGFALAASGTTAGFAEIGRHVLHDLLTDVRLDRPLDEAVEHVLSGMSELDLHPDVVPAVRRLHGAGVRQVTLSNGSAAVADALLTRADVRHCFERLLSVQDAGAWKPVATAYRYAAEVAGVRVEEMLLVAVHPWDIDGAARAGLRTAWVDRRAGRYPGYAATPDLSVRSLGELADHLLP
jgi:2-haloacid dehalogenase